MPEMDEGTTWQLCESVRILITSLFPFTACYVFDRCGFLKDNRAFQAGQGFNVTIVTISIFFTTRTYGMAAENKLCALTVVLDWSAYCL